MARKRPKASILKSINACKTNIAKERDKLRNLIDELEEIHSDCDEAVQDLESAADSLSRLL